MSIRTRTVIAMVAVFALLAVACGDSDTTATEAPTAVAEAPTEPAEAPTEPAEAPTEPEPMTLPGEGVNVTMARADWSTGYFQAELYKLILEELGYTVSEPSALELGPSLAYLSMSQGDFDFWVNSWYPGHVSWWEPELPDGSQVGDHLTAFGPAPDVAGKFAPNFANATGEMVAGGLQGFLITKSFADEYDVYTMDELNSNAAALAAFDAEDPDPGNGKADIYGCQQSWTCDDIILSQIAFSGWDNVVEVIAGYDAMVAEAIVKANAGLPMVIYTWTPSAYITELRPGDNVVWLGVDVVLDDSNPTDVEGGAAHSQLPGTAAIGPEQCPAAANLGTCQLGWIAADIFATANTAFAEANPAVAKVLELVTLSIIDVSLANVAMAGGLDTTADIRQLAIEWVASHRDLVDPWLAAAIAAA